MHHLDMVQVIKIAAKECDLDPETRQLGQVGRIAGGRHTQAAHPFSGHCHGRVSEIPRSRKRPKPRLIALRFYETAISSSSAVEVACSNRSGCPRINTRIGMQLPVEVLTTRARPVIF